MAIAITIWKFMFHRHLLQMYSLSALEPRKAGSMIASLVFCAVSATAAIAMDRGQFADVPLEVRQWFEHLRSPTGVPCCSYADGHRTGYDTRRDQYWVPIEGEWYPVPPEAVIKTANPVGEAIVWYQSNNNSEYVAVNSTDPK
jgi:hypothetical protein